MGVVERSVAERLRNLEKRHQARLAIRKSAAPPAAEVIVAMLSAGDWQSALKLLDLDVWPDRHSLEGGGTRQKRMGTVCADLSLLRQSIQSSCRWTTARAMGISVKELRTQLQARLDCRSEIPTDISLNAALFGRASTLSLALS